MLGELDETTMRSVRRLQHEHDVDVSSLAFSSKNEMKNC